MPGSPLAPPRAAARPRPVRTLLLVLRVQIVVNALTGLLSAAVLAAGSDYAGAALTWLSTGLALLTAAGLTAAALLTGRRDPRARPALLAVETVVLLGALLALVTGAFAGILALALSLAALLALRDPATREWLRG
jgi:hypothetical protein